MLGHARSSHCRRHAQNASSHSAHRVLPRHRQRARVRACERRRAPRRGWPHIVRGACHAAPRGALQRRSATFRLGVLEEDDGAKATSGVVLAAQEGGGGGAAPRKADLNVEGPVAVAAGGCQRQGARGGGRRLEWKPVPARAPQAAHWQDNTRRLPRPSGRRSVRAKPGAQAGVGPRTGGQSSAATGGILVKHGRRRRRRECSQPHAKAGRKGHRGDKSEGRRASRTGRCAQRLGGGYRGVGRRRSGGGVWGAGGTLRSARARCHGAAKQPISTAGRTANAGLSQRWPHEARVPPQRGARAHTQCFLEGGSSAWGRRSAQGSGATEAWAAGARAQGAPARRETRSHHDSHATRCVFSPR